MLMYVIQLPLELYVYNMCMYAGDSVCSHCTDAQEADETEDSSNPGTSQYHSELGDRV